MIENIDARTLDGRLALSWAAATVFRAIMVQVAADIEFTVRLRQFVLPPRTGSCSLDLGPGTWFYRIGGLFGQEDEGEILWGGIYPPVVIQSSKIVLPTVKGRLSLLSTQAIEGGVRLATNLKEPYLAFIDYAKGSATPASISKTIYIRDWGKGSLDCLGLSPDAEYSFRVATFVDGLDALPTDTVKPLADGSIVSGRHTAEPVRATTNRDKAEYAAERVLLRDVSHRPVVRFSSYVDYVKFQAAQARTKERARPV